MWDIIPDLKANSLNKILKILLVKNLIIMKKTLVQRNKKPLTEI